MKTIMNSAIFLCIFSIFSAQSVLAMEQAPAPGARAAEIAALKASLATPVKGAKVRRGSFDSTNTRVKPLSTIVKLLAADDSTKPKDVTSEKIVAPNAQTSNPAPASVVAPAGPVATPIVDVKGAPPKAKEADKEGNWITQNPKYSAAIATSLLVGGLAILFLVKRYKQNVAAPEA